MNTENTEVPAKAGERMQGMRKLMGISRREFSEITGIDYHRLGNMEQGKQRMNDDDIARVVRQFPHFVMWLVIGGDIDIDALAKERDATLQVVATKLRVGQVPPAFGLERFQREADDET